MFRSLLKRANQAVPTVPIRSTIGGGLPLRAVSAQAAVRSGQAQTTRTIQTAAANSLLSQRQSTISIRAATAISSVPKAAGLQRRGFATAGGGANGGGGGPTIQPRPWVNPQAVPVGDSLKKYAHDLTQLAKGQSTHSDAPPHHVLL